MHVVILTYGSRGDVEPFLSLAQGLQRSGHHARVAGPVVFAKLAEERGVEFVPLPGDPDSLVADLVRRAGHNPARMVRVMSRYVLPLAMDVMRAIEPACDGADVVVHSFLFTNGGHDVAVRKGIPDVSAQMFPVFTPTAAFPGVVAPDLPFGDGYRRLTHRLIQGAFWHGSRLLYGRIQKEHPDEPPLTGWPIGGHLSPPVPVLYAYSKHILPRPEDWPDWAHVTGYWFPELRDDDQATEGLVRFLASGPPPVYLGFGSVISGDPARLAQIAVRALDQCGRRGVIVTGSGGLRLGDVPPHVYAVEQVRHDWLFPRVAAAVHHGGAGTTGASLRAGLPTLIVPFTTDQPFWGRQVHRRGAGPAPIKPRRLTPPRLAEAIEELFTNERMRTSAAAIGEGIRGESGVGNAITVIERAVARNH